MDEVTHALLEQHMETDAAAFAELKSEQKELRALVQDLHRKMDKQKSFVGGVIFAATAIVSAVWGLFTFFYHK